MRRTRFVSAVETGSVTDSLRLRDDDFLPRKWFMPIFLWRSLPLPVTLNRDAAPLWVFCLGIPSLLRLSSPSAGPLSGPPPVSVPLLLGSRLLVPSRPLLRAGDVRASVRRRVSPRSLP